MSSKMEQIIEEIEEYIDGCKFQPLSNTKIIVNKEELEEYEKKCIEKIRRKKAGNMEEEKINQYLFRKGYPISKYE